MSKDQGDVGRKTGRPRKGEPPKLPYDELDQILVFGEVVKAGEGEGEGTTTVYPSYRELGRRYGVSHSLIAQYSLKHNCLRRRKEAKARVVAKTEQKLIEQRATAIALSREQEVQIIDECLVSFGKEVAEGRVRFDDPAHFDRLCRLKEYLQGGADSRQEIHAALSLQDLQTRHARMLRASQQATAAERGEVIDARPADDPEEPGRFLPDSPPAPLTEAAAGEVPGQFVGAGSEAGPGGPPRAASGAGQGAADHQTREGGSAPHGANVASTWPAPAQNGEPLRPPRPDQEGAS